MRNGVLALAGMATMAAAGQAVEQAAAGQELGPFADIPGVTLTPYDVAGRSAAAIRRAIDAGRPTDPNDGKRTDGLSHWGFRWRWHGNGHGGCEAAPADVVFTATVTVPRPADPDVPAKVRAQFDRYLQSLLAHEVGHVRYAWDHRGDIMAAINSTTCDRAGAAAQAALKAIAAHDIEYDRATRHGATTVLPFPG